MLLMQVESAQAAKQKAEEQLASLRQNQKAELEAEKSHYETLLQKARSAQAWLLLLLLQSGEHSDAVYEVTGHDDHSGRWKFICCLTEFAYTYTQRHVKGKLSTVIQESLCGQPQDSLAASASRLMSQACAGGGRAGSQGGGQGGAGAEAAGSRGARRVAGGNRG